MNHKQDLLNRLNDLMVELSDIAKELRESEDLTKEERTYITLLQAIGEQGQDKMKELGGME